MAIQDSIGFIKNKTINKIVHILENPSGACWQEETPDQARIANIEEIVREMNREIKNAKEKYKKRAEDPEQGVQADKHRSMEEEGDMDACRCKICGNLPVVSLEQRWENPSSDDQWRVTCIHSNDVVTVKAIEKDQAIISWNKLHSATAGVQNNGLQS